jgi:hypothetical protein
VTIYGDVDSWLRGGQASEMAEGQIRLALDRLRIGDAPGGIIEAVHGHLDNLLARSPSASGGIDRRIRSVGIFATESGAETFLLTTSPSPWVGVADRFLVGPLLAGVLALSPAAFVLAISELQVRLVDATGFPIEMIEVQGLPHDLANTIALDLTGDRNTLAHLRISEDQKGRLREFAREVDRVIEPVLRRAGAALVIAAAEPLASIYRSATDCELVLSPVIVGNHDADSIQALADFAAPVIELYRRQELDAQLTRLAELPDRSLVLADLDDIADATRIGAVDTLFVDTDVRVPVPGEAFEGLTTIDRVDDIIRDALSHDTMIVPVHPGDLSTPGPAAAILRYAPAVADRRREAVP